MAAVPISRPHALPLRPIATCVLLAVVVWAAARFGIWSRSTLELAVFWPANALLLGLFVRFPRLASFGGWAGALVGYLVADLTTGGPLVQTAWLTGANLAGVAVGLGLLRRLPPADQQLQRPWSLLHLGLACCGAAGAAAVVGLYCGTEFFALTPLAAVRTWFSSELAMYLALLPVVLTWPDRRYWSRPPGEADDAGAWLRGLGARLAPLPVLVVTLAVGQAIGGPGALAFALPVLLWCALRGGVFETALLVLVANAWTLLALNDGRLDVAFEYAELTTDTQVSVQVGLALTSLGPLLVAASSRVRDTALSQLAELATRDGLTGVLTRQAFHEQAGETVAEAHRAQVPVAVLMIDLDHFKGINDRHGHPAGDRVLVAMADAVRGCLRSTDLVGRMGGEEFAVVLPGIAAEEAACRAEELRAAVSELRVQTRDEATLLAVTASIGLAHAVPADAAGLADLLGRADEALYRAKRDGRDRVVVAGTGRPPVVDGPGPR